jgi:hypothetical protein
MEKITMPTKSTNEQLKTIQERMAASWAESRLNEVIKGFENNQDPQILMDNFPGFKEAFTELDTIDCSDGRVLKGKKIGIAGSGLLLSPVERANFIKNYKGKIKEVTTHRDCGAAKIGFAALKPEEIPAGVTTSDEYGTLLGKEMAAELGAVHTFLDMDEMANDYHDEVALVLDQSARFDSTNLEAFPPHFVCTGAGLGLSPEYMASEMETLTGIALGHHGYGDKFNRDNPFYLIVVAADEAGRQDWEKVAQEVAKKFDNRAIVKSLVSPEGR